jgi:hypothetical protein
MLPAALLWAALQEDPVAGPPIAIERVAPGVHEQHVFSGRTVALTLRVFGAQGRKVDVALRLYQLAHALAAPAGPAVEVASEVELGKSAWHDFTTSLDCPLVERASTFEVRFLARMHGEESWRDAGRARLELYPPDLLGGLRARAREKPWFVSDARGALKAFLSAHSIAFLDLERPEGKDAWARSQGANRDLEALQAPLLLFVLPDGAARSAALPEQAFRAIVFDATARAPLLVLEGGRSRLTLRPDLIPRLMDDPRAQSELVEAIDLLLLSDP